MQTRECRTKRAGCRRGENGSNECAWNGGWCLYSNKSEPIRKCGDQTVKGPFQGKIEGNEVGNKVTANRESCTAK